MHQTAVLSKLGIMHVVQGPYKVHCNVHTACEYVRHVSFMCLCDVKSV
jgi:hypothetical protein